MSLQNVPNLFIDSLKDDFVKFQTRFLFSRYEVRLFEVEDHVEKKFFAKSQIPNFLILSRRLLEKLLDLHHQNNLAFKLELSPIREVTEEF